MPKGIVINKRTGKIVAERVLRAGSFWLRLRGIIGRGHLGEGEGIWLIPCKQVHTFWVRFPLSIWVLDKDTRLITLFDNLQPWTISPYTKLGCSILEFPSGWGAKSEIEIGDVLLWEE